MAKVREMNEEGWREWVATRPESVQKLCVRLPPDRLYRMKSTGQRVTLLSYGEDDTLRVNVSAEYNAVHFRAPGIRRQRGRSGGMRSTDSGRTYGRAADRGRRHRGVLRRTTRS